MREYEELFGYESMDSKGLDVMVLATFVKDEDIGKFDGLRLTKIGKEMRDRAEYTEEKVLAEYKKWWKDGMIVSVSHDGHEVWKTLAVIKMLDWILEKDNIWWLDESCKEMKDRKHAHKVFDKKLHEGELYRDIAKCFGWEEDCIFNEDGEVSKAKYVKIFEERALQKIQEMVDLGECSPNEEREMRTDVTLSVAKMKAMYETLERMERIRNDRKAKA